MSGSIKLEHLQSSAGLSLSNAGSLAISNFKHFYRIVLRLSTLDLISYVHTATSDLDDMDALGTTPLFWPASRPDTEAVRILLDYGVSPSLRGQRQQRPLHCCTDSGIAQSKATVLQAKMNEARHQAYDWYGSSINEEKHGIPDNVRAIIDARDCKGRIPLHFETQSSSSLTVPMLNPSILCSIQRFSMGAMNWNNHEVLVVLLESDARIDILDSCKASLLHHAAQFGVPKTLTILSHANLGQLDVDT